MEKQPNQTPKIAQLFKYLGDRLLVGTGFDQIPPIPTKPAHHPLAIENRVEEAA